MSRTMVTLTREMQDDYGYNEAIKTLRTNILFCGSKVRVIMLPALFREREKVISRWLQPSLWPSWEKKSWSLTEISAVLYW